MIRFSHVRGAVPRERSERPFGSRSERSLVRAANASGRWSDPVRLHLTLIYFDAELHNRP